MALNGQEDSFPRAGEIPHTVPANPFPQTGRHRFIHVALSALIKGLSQWCSLTSHKRGLAFVFLFPETDESPPHWEAVWLDSGVLWRVGVGDLCPSRASSPRGSCAPAGSYSPAQRCDVVAQSPQPPQPPQQHHLLSELHLVYHRPRLVAQRPRLPAQDLLRVVEPNLRVLGSRQLGGRVLKGIQDRRRGRGRKGGKGDKSIINILKRTLWNLLHSPGLSQVRNGIA